MSETGETGRTSGPVGVRPATPPISVSDRTTEVNRTGSWKYMYPVYHDRVAPCNQGCPAGIDIEGYMTLLRDGRTDEACDLLLRENPMPAITGRVCDHPCEAACNRRHLDGAVAVHAVERMLGDRILASPLPSPQRRRRERVAVIGSGPAGLSCAHHLARLGYGVEVFERDAEPGGMLRQGIPAYRLPRDVLDATIERMKAAGVHFRCSAGIGSSVTWGELMSGFHAIFIGVGAHAGRPLGVPGEDLPGVWQGLSLLRAVNRGGRVRLGPARSARVVVIGGGNTAMDCARTARRLTDGGKVTVLYRRTRDEMPAIAEEVAQAEREGVEFVFLAAPAAIERRGGRLSIRCTPMRLGEPDERGRRRPVPSGAPPVRLTADSVLLAIGERVELQGFPAVLAGGESVHVDEWGRVRGIAGDAIVCAGGDVTGDDRTVAHAVGAGKRAAMAVDRHLRERRGEIVEDDLPALRFGERGAPSMARWMNDDPIPRVAPLNTVVTIEDLNLSHFALVPRHADREAAVTLARRHARFAEVNRGLDDATALAESARCFQCGVCNGCELCLIYCADVAIQRALDGDRFDIDLDYCKGCGVCAAECPRGALTMTRDGPAGAGRTPAEARA